MLQSICLNLQLLFQYWFRWKLKSGSVFQLSLAEAYYHCRLVNAGHVYSLTEIQFLNFVKCSYSFDRITLSSQTYDRLRKLSSPLLTFQFFDWFWGCFFWGDFEIDHQCCCNQILSRVWRVMQQTQELVDDTRRKEQMTLPLG